MKILNYFTTRLTQRTTWVGLGCLAVQVATNGPAGLLTPEGMAGLTAALGLVHVDK